MPGVELFAGDRRRAASGIAARRTAPGRAGDVGHRGGGAARAGGEGAGGGAHGGDRSGGRGGRAVRDDLERWAARGPVWHGSGDGEQATQGGGAARAAAGARGGSKEAE